MGGWRNGGCDWKGGVEGVTMGGWRNGGVL